MRSASVGHQCPDCVKEGSASIRAVRSPYGGSVHATALVTNALIGINVLVFIATTATGTGFAFGGNPSTLFNKLALIPTTHVGGQSFPASFGEGVAQGGYYRLLTSMFLHFGIVHIGLNMYCLYLMGPALERAFGRVRFLGLYLLSGLAGSMLSYAIGPQFEQAAGASGAVFGLFAAFFVVQRHRGGDVTQIGSTIALNLVFSFVASSYIDWRGHVGGLIGGALVAVALVHAPRQRRTAYQVGGALAVLVIIVLGVVVRTHVLRNGGSA